MPTHDIWHETVKKALIKDGWIITDDPLSIQFGGVDVYIDLAAEKLIVAEKEGKKIAGAHHPHGGGRHARPQNYGRNEEHAEIPQGVLLEGNQLQRWRPAPPD